MRIKGFTIVPDFMIQKYGYVGALIYGKIARYCEWSDMNICTASNSRLADELGMGESTIRKYKQAFKDDGLMAIVGKIGETDTVSIIEEMVLEMYTPLPDSEGVATKERGTPLPDSDKDTIKKQEDTATLDVIDAMLAYSKQSNGLEDYPPDVADYLEPFVAVFKRAPSASEKGYWIKTVREGWKPIGVKPDDVKKMFTFAKEQNTVIKSPASISYAYDEIRNNSDPLNQSATERGAVKEF